MRGTCWLSVLWVSGVLGDAAALGGLPRVDGAKAPAGVPHPIVREERRVTVDGRPEVWRLEWRQPPVPECSAESDEWSTCPCSGYAFGERGELDLVRRRGGKEIERLSLTPLFTGDMGFAAGAILRRVEPRESDYRDDEDEDLPRRVHRRPPAQIMKLEDYDHDGRASEFLLQVDVLPCGKRMAVAVGVSRSNPHLHVFHARDEPEEPLVLRIDQWEALRDASGPIRRVDWKCGDHASDTETELELQAGPRGIEVWEREYECDEDGHRGRLIRE
ncbi:MAG TPA: hypothetical protein VHB47_14985 [Thermoanaerobaculia bacterium]|nr:hypothetical protein [Thermoanaerobaculia bacterium]